MHKNLLNILLTIILTSIIYISNNQLSISIFFLIILSTLNKNYFSFLSIIPLFFINSNLFLFFIFFSTLMFLIMQIKINKSIKNLAIIVSMLLYYSYLLFIVKMDYHIPLLTLLTCLPIILLDTFKKGVNNEYTDEVLVMLIVILNIAYINVYLMVGLYTTLMFLFAISYKKPYYIITSFFITIYSLYLTNNFAYILIQISAYLCYLFKKIIITDKDVESIEFVIEDINLNVSKFLSFITNFSSLNYNREYEENLSSGIKILIENNCYKCRNKTTCYGSKKMETYIFLKDLLTNKDKPIYDTSIHNFNCLYYQDMISKAKVLSKEYNLKEEKNINDYKLDSICYSIQNYFISLFLKTTPKIIKILNFKKLIIDKNIPFTNFTHSILSDEKFQLKFYSNKPQSLEDIYTLALNYFDKDKISIIIKEDHVIIHPKKTYKVIYDCATLSYNNCQISGDNFLFKNINDSNFICALSDGMGSGYNAYKLSEQTLKMVEKITECNIDFKTSLEILNNFFKIKDTEDSYATLDFVDIDLCSGILNLYKMGSSTTFILRDDKVIPIYNNNLPFGISDMITQEEFALKDNDLVILATDGITDYIDENKLIAYIEKLKNESPHKIVYEILQKIYYENGNNIKDDMSCVVLKLKKA